MASDVKKKVVKNAGTTPVRTRVYPVWPPPNALPFPLKLGESGPDSPRPPRVHIIDQRKTSELLRNKEKNNFFIRLFCICSYPPIKGVPHEKGCIWLTGKSWPLDL